SRGETFIIDTLCDPSRTRRMLSAVRTAEPAAKRIDTVFITHWHVDHSMGLAALKDSRIIMSRLCAADIQNMPPEKWVQRIAGLEGDAKRMMDELTGHKFDFSDVEYVPPTDLFERHLELKVGDETIVIEEMGPTHTKSDSIVFVPGKDIAFGGDLLHPGIHLTLQHPFVDNWINACAKMLSWNAKLYVPGHRAFCRKADVEEHRDYLLFIKQEARKRFDAGTPALEAAEDMATKLGPFQHYRRPEALLTSVAMLYAGFEGKRTTARENYSEFLASRWHFRNRLRARYPELPMAF
ncbi:MAG TPA: MBL fold metallo-hydrolase, partial [Burkholderiales bacterium]|nr:MBL fold metallo-hydrolase [Burkholderiales bacterium]